MKEFLILYWDCFKGTVLGCIIVFIVGVVIEILEDDSFDNIELTVKKGEWIKCDRGRL